jgi:hypothetical protein
MQDPTLKRIEAKNGLESAQVVEHLPSKVQGPEFKPCNTINNNKKTHKAL